MTFENWTNLKKKVFLASEAYSEAAEKLTEEIFENKRINKKWTVHDITAHLSGWFREAESKMTEYQETDMIEDISYDIDKFNRQIVTSARDKSRESVLEEFQSSVKSLLTFADLISEINIEQTTRYEKWLEILLHELKHHTKQVIDI